MPAHATNELACRVLAFFESSMKHQALSAFNSDTPSCFFGATLGQALSLLFVSRHGLQSAELCDLLQRVKRQILWKKETEHTAVPVKLKLLKLLMEKKNRLIDVFRSFDTDGNG